MNDPRGVLAIIVTICIGLAMLFTAHGCGEGYSEGERFGQLRKFSHKGLMMKSWEGELLLSNGYIRKADGSGGPDVWAFSVTDEKIARMLEAVPANATVTVKYRQWAIKPISQDTSYCAVHLGFPPLKAP